MIPYNTDLEKLVLPEYGRLVHDLVKICSEIEDRDERNYLATSIVETMKAMTQEKGKLPDDRKYWDHLFVISGGKLDIDSPYGKPEEGSVHPVPQKIPYSNSDFTRRHYGRILQKMVHQVSVMPNSEDKDGCVELLANQIKKMLTVNNPENAGDERVFADLDAMSDGSIAVEAGVFFIPDYKEEKPTKQQKKKKNRQ